MAHGRIPVVEVIDGGDDRQHPVKQASAPSRANVSVRESPDVLSRPEYDGVHAFSSEEPFNLSSSQAKPRPPSILETSLSIDKVQYVYKDLKR
jgi:hypothetical protein